MCSDITNTLNGISSETELDGGNRPIYYVHSGDICREVVLNSQLVCHTTLLPHQGALALANFKNSEYFYNKYLRTLDRE